MTPSPSQNRIDGSQEPASQLQPEAPPESPSGTEDGVGEKQHFTPYRFPLRSRLLLIIIPVLAVAMSGMIVLATEFFKQDSEARLQEANLNLTRVLGRTIRLKLENLILRSESLLRGANRSAGFKGTDPDVIYVALINAGTRSNGTPVREIINEDYLRTTGLNRKRPREIVLANLGQFREAFAGGIVTRNLSPGSGTAVFAVALRPRGESRRIMVVLFTPVDFQRTLRSNGITRTFLTDLRGAVIAHPDDRLVLTAADLSPSPIVRAMLGSRIESVQLRYKDAQDVYHLGSFTKVTSLGLGIIAVVAEEKAFQVVYGIRRRNIYLTLIFLSLATLAIFLFARRITRPLELLAGAARKLESGQYDISPPERNTHDEIGELTSSFISMARELHALKTRLEKKVANRTAQLERSNDRLRNQIAARENAERELLAARDLAEAANQAKSAFLATMSHEIRTPLNGIIALNELLLETQLNAEQRDFAETARVSGEALLFIINDILDFSKIEAGSMVLESLPFNPGRCVEDVKDILESKARAKGLSLRVTIEPGVPEYCMGDMGRLRQVLLNIVGNAVKFTSKGEVSIRVETGEADELRFVVKDTGIGIPPDRMHGLFTPFFQVESDHARRYEGTGLGLAISRELVTAMGGEISADSKPGSGSVFRFSIQYTAVPEGMSIRAPEPVPQDMETLSRNAKRILIVEDYIINQKVVVRILESMGFKCDVASSGSEALKARETGDYELILMDCQMPEMDGYETTRRMRELESSRNLPGSRIIALTAEVLTGTREKCLAAGMNDYMAKPISRESLRKVLARNINQKSATPGTTG